MESPYAERARALVGARFRPQGRCGEGLDCLGLVIAAFDLPPDEIRRDYRLRGDHRAELERGLLTHFKKVRARDARPGDVLLLQVASDQLHLAIRSEAGFVHAHARIGRVVETPGMPEWLLLGAYRRRMLNRGRS